MGSHLSSNNDFAGEKHHPSSFDSSFQSEGYEYHSLNPIRESSV